MAAKSDKHDLNAFFKRMAEVSDESKKWDEYLNGYLTFAKLIEIWSVYLLKSTEKQVTFTQYGSSAEGLKCYLPHDIGDVDLMVFSEAKQMEVTEDMLENIAGKPGFVRIRGVNHPVLNNCLFEGSYFVATATLKNLHPEIFGEVSTSIDLVKKFILGLSPIQNSITIQKITNSPEGPAITVDMNQSIGSLTKKKGNFVYQNKYQNSSAAFELVEAFIASISEKLEVPYIKQRSVVLKSSLDFVKEQIRVSGDLRSYATNFFRRFKSVASTYLVSRLIDEMPREVCGIRMHELYQELQASLAVSENETDNIRSGLGKDLEEEIETLLRSQEFRELLEERHNNKSTHLSAEDQFPSTTVIEMWKNVDLVMSLFPGALNHALNVTDADVKRDKRLRTETAVREPLGRADSVPAFQGKRSTEDAGNERRETANPSQPESEPKPLNQQEQGYSNNKESGTKIGNSDKSSRLSADGLASKPAEKQLTSTDAKDERYSSNTEAAFLGFDFVPAFQGRGWPEVAQEWCTRPRQWPSHDVVEKITRESFHVVVKTPKTGGNPDLDFRLSFSNAEYLLSKEMNAVQKECYRCLKLFHRAFLCTDEKVLVSYHLKTLLLWSAEDSALEVWSEDNRACCVLTLLDKLQDALSRKVLPHYFIRSCNLFEHAASEHPDLLESLAAKVNDICQDPTCFKWEMVLDRSEPGAETADGDQGGIRPDAFAQMIPPDNQEDPTVAEAARPVSSEVTSPAVATAQSEASGNTDFVSPTIPPLPFERRDSRSYVSYHDFQDLFMDTVREIATLALSGADVRTDDPLLSELVKGVRAWSGEDPDVTVEDLLDVFKQCQTADVYASFAISAPGKDTRQRILGFLKTIINMINILLEEDFDPEDTQAIIQRLVDPNRGFIFGQFFPAGWLPDLVMAVLTFVDPACPTMNIKPDDIPLD